MMARYYRLAPPGIIFMVMAAAIAAYTPVFLSEIRQRVGLVTLGALFACIVAFLYSLYHVRRAAPLPQLHRLGMDFEYVVVDSIIIGGCVGLSLVIEILVVRNYGLAVIFITPLTILLAETTQAGQQTTQAIMVARVLDIALGSFVGLLGSAPLHLPAVRSRVARGVRAVLPSRGHNAV